MAIYATETAVYLALLCIPAMVSLYFFFIKENTKLGLSFLVLTGFLLCLFMAAVDPFLHPWDERFHALVAKNMMSYPFRPMLLVDPIYQYDLHDWSGTHIWLHKQPLFLWQMALSMKIFGVHEISMRLPSVIMTTINILLVYDLTKQWTKNSSAAYFAAFLFTFSNYHLELLAGRYMLEQNDVAFVFYMTLSIWALVRYTGSSKPLKWVVLIGLSAGAAILNKWLTGLLVFGGWGVYLLLEKTWRTNLTRWLHIALGFVICLLVFMPWQIYIMKAFPVESAITYAHNALHIRQVVEGHDGTVWFHLDQMFRHYGKLVIAGFIVGFYFLLRSKKVSTKLTIALFAMVLVIYLFFSLIVATKMPAFTYPVNAIFWALSGLGLYETLNMFLPKRIRKIMFPLLLFVMAIYTLKPTEMVEYRSYSNKWRVAKINNTKMFKGLDLANDYPGKVIVNLKSYDHLDLMFYQDVNAYHWFPKEAELDSLVNEGFQFAAFESFGNQFLPDYILENENVTIIHERIE